MMRGLAPRHVAIVCESFQPRRYRMGEMISTPGERHQQLWVVHKGTARISAIAPGNSDGHLTVELAGPREFFADASSDGEQHTIEEIDAMSDVIAYAAPIEHIAAHCARFPRFASNLLILLEGKLERMRKLAAGLAHDPVALRLRELLIELLDEYGHPTMSGGMVINQRLTQGDLAQMVGASRQVVSSALTELHNEGIIEIQKRRIFVHDLEALHSLGLH